MTFRVCERFGMLPPGVHPDWEDNSNWVKCLLWGYEQVRETEGEQ